MANNSAFQLTAQVVLKGPDVGPLKRKLTKQLGGLTIPIKLSKGAKGKLDNLNASVRALRKETKSSTKAVGQLNSAMGKLSSRFKAADAGARSMASHQDKVAKAYEKSTKTAKQNAKATAMVKDEIREFGRVSGLAIRRFAGFTIATTVVFGLTRSFTAAYKEAIQFEREMIKVGQVTGKTGQRRCHRDLVYSHLDYAECCSQFSPAGSRGNRSSACDRV